MLETLLILAIIVFGFVIMLGGKTENFSKLLLWLVFAPILIEIAYFCLAQAWNTAAWVQFLIILLLPFFIAALLRVMFPKAKWLAFLQTIIFQTLIYFVTFPFRFLWRAGQFFVRRERHVQRLDPHRSFVGGSPPVIKERQNRESRNKHLEG